MPISQNISVEQAVASAPTSPSARPVKDMAYTLSMPGGNEPQTFRLRRGNLPVYRAGVAVNSVPRFRGVILHSQIAGNAPAPFASTNSNTVIKWPGVPGV